MSLYHYCSVPTVLQWKNQGFYVWLELHSRHLPPYKSLLRLKEGRFKGNKTVETQTTFTLTVKCSQTIEKMISAGLRIFFRIFSMSMSHFVIFGLVLFGVKSGEFAASRHDKMISITDLQVLVSWGLWTQEGFWSDHQGFCYTSDLKGAPCYVYKRISCCSGRVLWSRIDVKTLVYALRIRLLSLENMH